MEKPFSIHWKLGELLEREGVSVYRLNQELNQRVSRNTLYRWASEMPDRPDLETLGWVMWGIEQITGKSYQLSDILEYRRG